MSARHIPRVYCAPPLQDGGIVSLDSAAAHHLTRVLRLRVGDALVAFDGSGGEYPARIHGSDKRETSILLGEKQSVERESPLRITLLQGVARGERMDLSIGKAVELGVAEIQPLMLARSQGMKTAQLQRKQRHWQSVAQSAAEQSGRTRLPAVLETCGLADWLGRDQAYDKRLVLHPGLAAGTAHSDRPPAALALLIGPEGGLTDEEVEAVKAAGFTGLSLGPRILRTETAAMAAITLCQSLWGDFHGR